MGDAPSGAAGIDAPGPVEPVLGPLSRWAAALDDRSVPAGTHQALANLALDWAGAGIAGTAHPLHARYTAAFAACGNPADAAEGGCAVLGDRRVWPVAEAAAVNAVISHLWEFDDAHRVATMHPGITVWPAVFALAQSRGGVNASRMRAAVVAGYEVGVRVGALLGKQHYAVCHTTGTAGTFAAAAAAGRLLGLDAKRMLSAMGHAGTQAASLWQFLDDGATDAKAFHAGVAVRNGVTAALLADAGIPGAPRILEGPRGMLKAWNLTPDLHQDLIPPPGAPLEVARTTIKSWPVCGQMHSLLDATEALRRRCRLAPDDLARVRVDVPSAVLAIADLKRPGTVAELKFSTSFCVALLLSGGALPFAGLDDGVLADAAVHRLADRIELVPDAAFDDRFPRERPARITVWSGAGDAHVEERSFRRGDPEAPWPWEPLVDRFHEIAGLAGAPASARRAVVEWCAAFGHGEAVQPAADAIFVTPFRREREAAA